jgi:hypothetical protein
MTTLYRVLPYLPSAQPGAPGHPLHLPPSNGASRVDNPALYDVLYFGDSAAGAMAEAFGWAPIWDAGLFRGTPSLPGSVRALATYSLDATVCDLDDAVRLVELGLRPSHVVTRVRSVTQRWAADLHSRDEFAGVRWWSYYDPRWGSFGVWDIATLAQVSVETLDDIDQSDFAEAADVLNRIRQ